MKGLRIRYSTVTKRLFPYLLTAFMSLFGLNAYAYDIAVKNADGMTIYYSFNSSGLTVTNSNVYDGDFHGHDYSGDVVIPELVEYGGKSYKVTAIGNEAFFRCSGMTSISIPSSVKFISSDETFYGCYSLTSVIISDLSSWCNVGFGKASANPLTYARHLFLNNKKVTKLIIPDDVTNISSYAFSGCSDLTSVTIPNSVSSIGEGAFKGCNGLTSITIPNSVTSVGSYAFDGTPWLDNQPDGLVYVGKVAYKCKGEMTAYTRITIKDGTFGIADNAFYGCSGLTSVAIPNSVTSIGSEAFSGCSGLTSITIPNSVTFVGSSAFQDCSGLSSITIPNSITSIGSSVFSGCSGLSSITIPNSVTSIDYSAFRNCSGLTSITIPNSVTSIDNYAFSGCSGLTSVAIPNSVTSIGSEAFSGCSGLTSIKIESGNKKYDSRNNCNAIIETSSNTLLIGCKNTNIPNSVTSIGYSAFSGCSGLTSITIPNSVTSIGSSAFWYCSGLTSVTIPNSVTSIGGGAFRGCSGLASITIPNSVTTISDGAFSGCSGLTSITIPNSVTSIAGYAFENCSGLSSISIPNRSDISISETAFKGTAWYDNQPDGLVYAGKIAYMYKGEMPANTHITIKDGTLGIANNVLRDHSSLTSITIPNSVESIGGYAFYNCKGLTSVTIPNSVTSISDHAFLNCSGLTSIKVESGNQKYDSRNNCNAIIETSSNTLLFGCKNTNIPNTVTSIGSSAFNSCSGLTSVTIPNSVTSIGSSAFYGCSGLTSIIIPNSVTSIESGAFDGTAWYNNQPDGLVYAGKVAYEYKGVMPDNTRITLKEGTTGIAGSAFSYYSRLTSITIPNSVTSIGSYAFYRCSGLTSVTIPNCVTSIGSYAFYYCRGLTSVTIPNCVTSIDNSTFYNCSGLTSVTIPNSVTSIGSSAFYGCSGLTSIIIPNNVTSIGDLAFCNCSGLTSVTIPNSVTSIGNRAFSNCMGLSSVIIPNSISTIGSFAFDYCKGLTTITSEIEKPFEIYSSTFDSDTYNVAELIVPYGTRGAYQNTEGWNKFTMITEAPDKNAVAFTIDGIAYEGSKSEKTVVVKSVDTKQTSIEIPASVSYDGITYQVTGIADGVFDGSSMAALIWNVEAALTNSAFNNASIGSNFLLYVKSSSYALSSVKNVVVDGTAQTIVLSDDGGQFYCPQAFTARRISYSHNYSMETGKGSTMGWESIALPFDVQRIIHSTQGEVVPFADYISGSNQKPFWLAYMSAGGFKRTADIKANEAYIIAMPNNSSYQDNYILAGDVTFSAENITVPKTPTFKGTFLPAFSLVAKSSSVYALNVNNRYVRYSGGEKPGSVFIRDLRDVRPFEAYLTGNFTRGVIEINFDNGTTTLNEELRMKNEESAGAAEGEIVIHALSGQQVTRTTQRDFDAVWQQLPKGVYIVNGKKLIK